MYKIISIDDEKESLPGYSPENAGDFHAESARSANKKFDQELRKIKNKEVVLMCGGSASGKTEFIAKFCPVEGENFEGIIFDSTLPSEKGAEIKIKNIKKSGNIPVIYFILPSSLTRCFRAFHKRDRKIPESEFFKTHSGARRVALWIAKNYPEVKICLYYNRLLEEVIESEKNPQIVIDEGDLGFVEISFEGRSELILFLEKEQFSEEEIAILIAKGR